jgi:hypothetical protein
MRLTKTTLWRITAASLTTACTLLAACGGGQAGNSSLMAQTAAGKNKCVLDGDESRLFVVDWDGTDSSAFEAFAARDVVLVKLDGCEMKVLKGCEDDGIQGAYGHYQAPQFTSGSVESISIKNDDELHAKLPLGVATFGGEVASGKALKLDYFVTGTVRSFRDDVYRNDIKANPRCAEATHFVSSYNLGAYSLQTENSLKASGDVGVGAFGGGGSHSEQTSALKKAGDLTNCTTVDQHACRAPIRLVLRRIADGARPPAFVAGPGGSIGPANGSVPNTQGALDAATSMMDVAKLRISAEQKLNGGDAQGCLLDLDRAVRADPNNAQNNDINMLRGRCQMRAGQCDVGKQTWRAARAAWERAMSMPNVTDASLDGETAQAAQQWCASAATGGTSATMQMTTLFQSIMQAAAAKDGATCVAQGTALDKASQVPGATSDLLMKQAATSGLRAAALCAAAAGDCAHAKDLWRSYTRNLFGHASDAEVDAGFKQNVAGCTN